MSTTTKRPETAKKSAPRAKTETTKTINLEPERDVTAEDLAEDASRLAADLRQYAIDSGFALLGLTDLAVERVRDATERAHAVREDLTSRTVTGEVRRLQDTVVKLPSEALTLSLEAAERAEERLDDLSRRGRTLAERVLNSEQVEELTKQFESTIARGKAVATSGVRTVTETTKASSRVASSAAKGAADVVSDVADGVEEAAETLADSADEAAQTARKAAKRTSKRTTAARRTADKRASATSSKAKAAATSANKAAEAAAEATKESADKVGDGASK